MMHDRSEYVRMYVQAQRICRFVYLHFRASWGSMFSLRWIFRCWFGFKHRVTLEIFTDVSDEPSASTFKLEVKMEEVGSW